ncbi:I78 family peptidase inhibitor [Pseudomonas sp. NCCP-436]|uniref:I78 family peptidase inhibitor n=1 Tax=Pseudomonas sp. NCCP-436 TaxID=2842481 RepID=UPI001C8165BE|nr:I78 family peptidase inhibitor [Pseudomonas sp. NCCP-436]GIZ13531.1 lipoprotein [Pseudomonas sp. NCCP-436]
MNLSIRLSSLLGCLLLAAGCSSTAQQAEPAATTSATTPSHESCTSSAVEHLVGQVATPELLEQARQSAGASRARLLAPGSIVTLEYDRQRLNLNVDDQRVITRVSCG